MKPRTQPSSYNICAPVARAASSSRFSPSPPSDVRRGLGRGGPFLLVSPLLSPLPTRASRGEEGELDAALPGCAPGRSALDLLRPLCVMGSKKVKHEHETK